LYLESLSNRQTGTDPVEQQILLLLPVFFFVKNFLLFTY
jgi:hypothetical protein